MAEEKITQKTALTTPADEDLLYIVDDPGGTPIGKKITLTNLFTYAPGTIDLADITDNNIPYMSASGFADSPISTDGTDVTNTGNFKESADPQAHGLGTITTSAYTIYVDGSSGNDSNAGTSGSKLATIQEAIDRLPDLIAHEVTIDIADATYAETLVLQNKLATTSAGNIKFSGNIGTPANVEVDPSDAGTCFTITNLPGCPVEIEGMKFDHGNGYGILFNSCSDITINNVTATNCAVYGILLNNSYWVQDPVTGLNISGNDLHGVGAEDNSHVEILGGDTTNLDEIVIDNNTSGDGIVVSRKTFFLIRYATVGGNGDRAMEVYQDGFGNLRNSKEGVSGDNGNVNHDVYAASGSNIFVADSSDFSHGADASSNDLS